MNKVARHAGRVLRTLNICPRTVQTLRDNGTLAYTQISTRPTKQAGGSDGYRSSSEDKKGHCAFASAQVRLSIYNSHFIQCSK